MSASIDASSRWLAVAVILALAAPTPAQASSQGPVADGPYVGTLPCADCAGIRTELTLFTLGAQGQPEVYRLRSTYLGTRDGDRAEERVGPWLRLTEQQGERIRLEPYDDLLRQTFRRKDVDTLVLLDREEKPIETQHDLSIVRDRFAAPARRVDVSRTLFRGTLRREGERVVLTPCAGGRPERVRDVSPESVISAVIADLGFDRRDSLYIEAFGRRGDGALMFERLNRAGAEMRCARPGEAMVLRAQGNEPAWSLVSSGQRVALTRIDQAPLNTPPVPVSWRWPGGRSDRAEARVVTSTESGALTAVLRPKICRDSMADNAYGFTAVVNVQRPRRAELSGCGYLGSAMLP